MISNLKPHQLIYRDGASQQDRYLEPLSPEYVQVEARSTEDLIREAQRLAKELCFFNEDTLRENHQDVPTWEAFLIGDAAGYSAQGETGKAIQRKQWAGQLAAYLKAPESFRNDPEKLVRLSRPHVVLFLAFLKLLDPVKSQLNGLTKKHLDFYFRERLGLTPKEAVPDVVNVLLELAGDVKQLEVKQGTVLVAGEDEEGRELRYKTDRDAVISEAEITQLKTVFVEKHTWSIESARQEHVDDGDNGLTRMMEMALGRPGPGDPLPPLPEGIEDLEALHDALLKQGDAAMRGYVTEELFLSIENFNRIIQTHLRAQDPKVLVEPQEWQEVYELLDQAFKAKAKQKRMQGLKELRESDGFGQLLKQVYGSPGPGDELPPYKGEKASFIAIYEDLRPSGESDALGGGDANTVRNKALEYVFNELRLTEKEFVRLVEVSEEPKEKAEDWEEIYEMLELADRKVRGQSLPSPFKEELLNVYAEPDAKAAVFSLSGEEGESLRFRTFGGRPAGKEHLLKPAAIGFALSSPLLVLREGQRQITATVALDPESGDMEEIKTLFSLPGEEDFLPFQLYLTGEEKWLQPENTSFSFGDCIVGAWEKEYEGTLDEDKKEVTLTGDDGVAVLDDDTGKYLVWTDGRIFEITSINTANTTVTVKQVGRADAPGQIQKYPPEHIYLNALKVVVKLEEKDPPVAPLDPAVPDQFIRSEFPALVFSLNHVLAEENQTYRSHYQKLMKLKMHKVHLNVEVEGMRGLTLQNDFSEIDPKKPFEPFGYEPGTGNSFYLTNEEIACKRLDDLELDLQWMKAPENFEEYYESYWLIENYPPLEEDESGSGSPGDQPYYTIGGNADFQARVYLQDKHAELKIGDIELFPSDGKARIEAIPGKVQSSSPSYPYTTGTGYRTDDENVLEWDRYFRLELGNPDFQHQLYTSLFGKQALSEDPNIRKLHINPPYTPKLKRLRISYSAHTEIVMGGETDAAEHDRFYHLHPFGFDRLKAGQSPSLLPSYTHEGALYMGIDRLVTPQVLSVLFQMAEGSADPDVGKPRVQWSYLRDNQWIPLGERSILSDGTNGLVNTGIIRIELPAEVTSRNTLLPGELCWLKAAVDRDATGLSDTVDVAAQAISATLCSEEAAPGHFLTPLAPGSVTGTLEPGPGIRKITQPYTSAKGKPAERETAFYSRVSERLRHKNRAVAMWDYERMVLDRFPEVYKVKCLPGIIGQGADRLGKVDVIVVPDIRGKLPFNPFEPKVPADTLFQIQNYLEAHTPACAEVVVRNPGYLQVRTRSVVKFKTGYNEGFYTAKLIDELKRFLAPWAYHEGSDITIGGAIDPSAIINFIAERPYIEYVANLKLFQSEDGEHFTDVRSLHGGKNKVIATRPDVILVSALSHEIDIVDEKGYDEDNFKGINYMKVELDFQVAEDLFQSDVVDEN